MKCVVCGIREGTEKLEVSDRFVSYAELFAGDLVCDRCALLFKDRKLRSSNWILLNGEFRVLDKKELINVLKDPPIGSLIYVKASGRKYGFLKCMKCSSTKVLVALCGEEEGAVVVDRKKLAELVDLAERAYSKLKRKSALLGGCSARDWVNEEICKEIECVRGDPAWKLVVRAL